MTAIPVHTTKTKFTQKATVRRVEPLPVSGSLSSATCTGNGNAELTRTTRHTHDVRPGSHDSELTDTCFFDLADVALDVKAPRQTRDALGETRHTLLKWQ